MSPDLFTIIVGFFPWGAVKLAILVLILMYIIFAAVIVRQEQLMARVVEIPFSPALRLVSLIHLLVSLAVFFLALILL